MPQANLSSVTYDPIMDALLLYLQNQLGQNGLQPIFQYMARGAIMWPQLSQLQNNNPIIRQPALFLYDGVGFGGGKVKYVHQGRAQPVIRTISRTIIIYAKAPAPAGQPGGLTGGKGLLPKGGGAIFHPLVEAVETALATPDDPVRGTLTLGGLVAYCRVEGEQYLSPPDIDDNGQGMATLPVEIRIP